MSTTKESEIGVCQSRRDAGRHGSHAIRSCAVVCPSCFCLALTLVMVCCVVKAQRCEMTVLIQWGSEVPERCCLSIGIPSQQDISSPLTLPYLLFALLLRAPLSPLPRFPRRTADMHNYLGSPYLRYCEHAHLHMGIPSPHHTSGSSLGISRKHIF